MTFFLTMEENKPIQPADPAGSTAVTPKEPAENTETTVLRSYVDDSVKETDKLDAVVGLDSIRMKRPRDPAAARRARHKARRLRRRRLYRASVCIISAVAILASIAWYLFSPLYGSGDLSETVTADSINKARDKFSVEQYYDKVEGDVLSYNIYIPFDYTPTKHYPMMVFISDSTSVGTDVRKPVDNSFGAAIWATDAAQAKDPCFVVVPNYPENTMDKGIGIISRYGDMTARLIESVARKYNVDATRIYGAGEDMGASMLVYIAAGDTDMFNTLLLNSDSSYTFDLTGLEDNRFIYFACEGDTAAIEHQQRVKAAMLERGIEYGELSGLDAEAPVEELNYSAAQMLEKDYDRNFVTWRSGTVGLSLSGGEHRASYRFGYKIDVIRDWIFE